MLEFDDVTKSWESGRGLDSVVALKNFDLTVSAGEFVTVIGPSGCGKSTLLELATGLETATNGVVRVNGEVVNGPRTDVGMVFQADATLPWLTAQRNIEFALEFNGVHPKARSEQARNALAQVGLLDFADYRPSQLSGGMRQRINIARVLAVFPRVVLMDEPFGALDEQTRLRLGDQLLGLWSDREASILFVTHSLNEAAMLSDRIVAMTGRPGQVREIIDNPVPRPRGSEAIGTPEFTKLTSHLWQLLREEAVAEELVYQFDD